MRKFIAPDLRLSDPVYFHSFTAIDYEVGSFGVYSNADDHDVQGALEDIASAITEENTFETNGDLYRREFVVEDEDQDTWIQLGNGDAIANSWNDSFHCESVSAREVLNEVFEGNFYQPHIKEGTIYTFTDDDDEEFKTMSREEAVERAKDINEIDEEHGFIAWFSNSDSFDPTDYEIFDSYGEAADYLFEQRPRRYYTTEMEHVDISDLTM